MYRGLLDEAEDNMNCILRVSEATGLSAMDRCTSHPRIPRLAMQQLCPISRCSQAALSLSTRCIEALNLDTGSPCTSFSHLVCSTGCRQDGHNRAAIKRRACVYQGLTNRLHLPARLVLIAASLSHGHLSTQTISCLKNLLDKCVFVLNGPHDSRFESRYNHDNNQGVAVVQRRPSFFTHNNLICII
jgi:hypothetical protein